LAAFPGAVSDAAMEGRSKPALSDGSGRDRAAARRALALLKEAGWSIVDGVMTQRETGQPLRFEILVASYLQERLALNYADSLKRIGVEAIVRRAEEVSYRQRQQTFNFDMIQFRWPASLSPGNEQNYRWSRAAASAQGSFNYAGVDNPAADAMIAALLSARTREDFVSAVRALDRVLISGHYVVPLYNSRSDWLARWAHIARPERAALTGAPIETFWRATP
jgi:peptide/nickel transport system substrate-binding protein